MTSDIGCTPGPWVNMGEYSALKDEIGVKGRAVCTVWTRRKDGVLREDQQIVRDAEGEANAALIIASPELYAALEGALSFIIDHYDPSLDYDFDLKQRVEAALAKARGESND